MRFFQRALLGFKNLWIHFVFSEFNCVSMMAKISSPLFKMEKSWTTCQGGCIFFPVPEEIIYSFLVYFGILQIWPMYHSLDKRVWLTITPFKESHSDPDMDFFAMSSFILLHLELSRIELQKLTPSILMEIFVISFVLVDQFFFICTSPLRLDFLKSWIFELNASL